MYLCVRREELRVHVPRAAGRFCFFKKKIFLGNKKKKKIFFEKIWARKI